MAWDGTDKCPKDNPGDALGSKILFGYFLALLQLFRPQIFLGEELQVASVACPRHHKTRSGLPHSCAMR